MIGSIVKAARKNIKWLVIAVGCAIVLLPLIWLMWVRFEGEKPSLDPDSLSAHIGKSHEMLVATSDMKSGLRKLKVTLSKDGQEVVLHEAQFPSGTLWKAGKINSTSIKIPVETAKLGFTDGEAILRVMVWDHSWRGWWKGNLTVIEKTVAIDTRSPEIVVLSQAHNLNQGGAGLVIFRTSEPCASAGVHVGDHFFPGYTGLFNHDHVYSAFIALGYDQPADTKISVAAVDLAGNSTQTGIHQYIRRKKFKQDVLEISDEFLNRIVPEFESALPQDSNLTLIDKFLFINRDLREANHQRILEVGRKTDQLMHWKEDFLRLPRAAPRAGFADHRVYRYKEKEIDRQVHLGVDLASLTNSPVPAANGGKVVFSDYLGIYGRTVIVDHGFGLFSMYSHLSHIAVQPGEQLAKEQILGRTGETGLAGGDHLHFGMYIHDTFVDPVEWWDMNWITNNILSKIEAVNSSLKQE
jgi:murein DD-endopeptidase MepM/ murein hydrolase activator NlpD